MAPLQANHTNHDLIESFLEESDSDQSNRATQRSDSGSFPDYGSSQHLRFSWTLWQGCTRDENHLSDTLSTLHCTAMNTYQNNIVNNSKVEHQNPPLPCVPPELIQYVDNGRNPDIYTREFVELARKSNQLMKGKIEAFADFRDVLAGEMRKALPELEADIAMVLERTGGNSKFCEKENN